MLGTKQTLRAGGTLFLNRVIVSAFFAASVTALPGCAVFDDGEREIPKVELPQAFKNAGAEAAPETPPVELLAPQSQWWKSFGNDELDRLVATTLGNNHDLKVAILRVTQASAQADIADALRYPTLNADLKYSVNAPRDGIGTAVDGLKNQSQRLPQVGLRTAWEIDLWGKNAYASESAMALAQASIHQREAVALSLTADVAKTYIDYLAASDRLRLAESNLANTQNALKAVQTRMERGDATLIEVQQQETAVANASAAVPLHRLNREKAFNKLAALAGMTPAELSLSGGTLAGLKMPTVSKGIPSQLICRRPDIRRAEANMLSADADIRVARAKMYPNFSFSLEGGRGGYSFASLMSPQSTFFTLIGQVTQSIFDAGQARSGVRQSEAKHQEMVETYYQVILDAVRDVEDALVTLSVTADQQKALTKAADHARRAFDMSSQSFERGAVDYTTLLDTQRTLFTTEDGAANVTADRLKASIDLFKALGGGIEEPHC